MIDFVSTISCRKAGSPQVITLALDLALEEVCWLLPWLFFYNSTSLSMTTTLLQACIQAIAATVSSLGGDVNTFSKYCFEI